MSEYPTVTIIVLNYNGLRHLKDCFSSLTQLDYPEAQLELMLVDNASTDGSVEYVQVNYPQVQIVRNEENLGFASGNNCGARKAIGQYIVFLNNDMWVDPQFVRGLVKAVQSDPEVVSAAAKILNWDGTYLDFAGSICNYAGHAAQVGFGQPYSRDQFTQIKPMLFACGGAMIIDRQVFLDVGGFDDDYFIYFEDVDLGWRLWLLGYKVVFAPDAITNHRHHGTMSSFSNYRQMVLYKRNALYSMLKNYSDENLGRMLPAVLLATAGGVVEQAVASQQLDKDAYYIKSAKSLDDSPISLDKLNVSALVAMQDVVEHLPQMMEKRRKVQQKRKRSDEEIAQLFRPFFPTIPGISPQTSYTVAEAFNVQQLFKDAPRRVLVISPDLLPYPGLPTVGSGLRAWGLGQGLKSCGHEVLFSMPRASLNRFEKLVPPEILRLAWEPHGMVDVVNTVQPDIVVVCGWGILEHLTQDPMFRVPVILDQHGPHMLEREYQNLGDWNSNAQAKICALQKADFFACAGEKQLVYFQLWLERAGWTEQERRERTAAIPISLSPDLPEHHPQDELTFVYGGVFLPWQDPANGLSTLVEVLERRNGGKLCLFGGKHPWIPIDTGIFDNLLMQLQKSPHVALLGTVPHNELITKYSYAHVAMDLMKRNRERDLAFTTRTVEYLWCGLPVIYNDYAELTDYIREYNAGWIVDPEDTEAIAAVLNEIFEHPEQVAERSLNAQRLVRERLTWDRTIDPIDGFVRRPSMRHRPLLNPPPQTELEHLQYSSQLQPTTTELERLKATITAMETSKFWKLRKMWFRFKKTVGLPTTD